MGLLDRRHVPVGLGKLEWSCHVCGTVRPDAEMGVISRERDIGVPMQENLRYCLVTDSCVKAAEAWRDHAPLATSWKDGLP